MGRRISPKKAEQHINLLRLLNEVNIFIAEATEIDVVMRYVGEVIRREIGAGICVSLVEEKNRMQVWIDTDRTESRYCYVLSAGTIESHIMKNGQTQIVYPLTESVHINLLPLQKYGTLCLLPIRYKVIPEGILHVFYDKETKVESYLLEFLEGIAVRLGIAVHNWYQQQDLQYERQKLQLLYDMMAVAADADKDLEDVFELVHRQIADTFHFSRVMIGLIDEQQSKIVPANPSDQIAQEWADSLTLSALAGDDSKQTQDAVNASDSHNKAVVPIMYKDKLLGIIYTENEDNKRFADVQMQFLTAVAQQLGTIMMNVRQYEHIKKLAITDGLTGLHTRQYFSERYAEEYAGAQRYNTPLCLIMIDIDDFKKINDTYGHVTGDKVLIAVSRMIQRKVRTYDIVARYGGEELILLLPRTALTDAFRIAERIRDSFHTLAFPFKITASIGLAAYPHHAQDKEDLLMLADDAMYRAKHQGKDRIKVAHAK
jgi:diguanylate cyclase (GGDEF)-like protein